MTATISDAGPAGARFRRTAEKTLFVALPLGLAWAPFWLGGDRMIPVGS